MVLDIRLTGPFGQSQALYRVRNEAKRGRGSLAAVEEQIRKDTDFVLEKQREAGVTELCDPLFAQYYLFQPFVECVHNVSVGPQENWFNNNVFFRRPQINASAYKDTSLVSSTPFTSKYHRGKSEVAILPSPFTLLMLSNFSGFTDQREAITRVSQILHNEAKLLVQEGYRRIQYDEPALVYMQSLGSLKPAHLDLLQQGLEICGRVPGAVTSLHTYFGNAGPVLSRLLDLPVDGLGIDCTETPLDDFLLYSFPGKDLTLGLVDARTTAWEDPTTLVASLKKIDYFCQPRTLSLTPNTGTEYRGWSHGLRKLELLAETKRLYNHG